MREVTELAIRMAQENSGWGYRRIQGGLKHLGLEVSHMTVYNILRRNGLDPSPKRGEESNWQRFIRSHMEVLGAMDFFTVEVWTLRGLVRYSVHFVMDVGTRRVLVTRIAPDWDGPIMANLARGLTDIEDGFMRRMRYAIMDNDPLYTRRFRDLLRSGGVKPVMLAPSCPYLNAFAERFVKSIKTECLDHFIFFGESPLRRAVDEYIAHYNAERPHQALENNVIGFDPQEPEREGLIEVRERLGGLLKYYHRQPVKPKNGKEVLAA